MPSFQGLETRLVNRYAVDRPPHLVHGLDEMAKEATRRYAQHLEALFEAGCHECGDTAVAIIYPPDVRFQLVENGRRPHEPARRAVEITVLVRILCAQHLHEEGPQ